MVARGLFLALGTCLCSLVAAQNGTSNGTAPVMLNSAAEVALARLDPRRDYPYSDLPTSWYELKIDDIEEGMDRGVCGLNSLTTTSEPGACKISMTFPNGFRAICSGWIADRDVVGTAGHCVYNKESGGYATNIYVECGKKNTCEGGTNSYKGLKWVTTNGWIQNGHVGECERFRNDGALIKVAGNFKRSHVNTIETFSCMGVESFSVSGYPGSGGQGCEAYSACVQKTATGTFTCPSNTFASCGVLSSSSVDGCAGMSGSGIKSRSGSIFGIYAAQRMGFICANYFSYIVDEPGMDGVNLPDLFRALDK